ncbi:MAG: hypothetical protein KGZ51_01710 [Erysipelothrix sp.]|jgi:drug/metabolite transporter (DMT)-like permease|nr:hypothetical protein [Erysipelothrix sp.]
MEAILRVLGMALLVGFGTAFMVYIVSRFKLSKLIWGAYVLLALSVLSALWAFFGPNTSGWDDLIYIIYAMVLGAAGVLYLIGLWIFTALRKKR